MWRIISSALALLMAVVLWGPDSAVASSAPAGRIKMPGGFFAWVERFVADQPSADTFLTEVQEGGGCGCDWVYPVDDLNEDGVADVVDATLHTQTNERSTELNVRSGRTGDKLFRAPVRLPGWAFAVQAEVGPDGKQGLIFESFDYRFAPYSILFELTLGAVDAEGNVLWQRQWTSGYVGGGEIARLHDLVVVRPESGPAEIVLANAILPGDGEVLTLEWVSASDGEVEGRWSAAKRRRGGRVVAGGSTPV